MIGPVSLGGAYIEKTDMIIAGEPSHKMQLAETRETRIDVAHQPRSLYGPVARGDRSQHR